MTVEDRNGPFRFGPAELFVRCDLGDADALALDEDEGVRGYKSLDAESIKIESVVFDAALIRRKRDR